MKSEEIAKKPANTHAGIEISSVTDLVCFSFIKSINRTIQSEFHELVERDKSVFPYIVRDYFVERIQER